MSQRISMQSNLHSIRILIMGQFISGQCVEMLLVIASLYDGPLYYVSTLMWKGFGHLKSNTDLIK